MQLHAADRDAEKKLLHAIRRGDLAEVEKIADGLDLSKIKNLNSYAKGSPNADVVDFLQEQQGLGFSDLQMSAIRGDAEAIKKFAESTGKAARKYKLQRGYFGGLSSETPLMLAARYGRTAAVRALIEAGAEVNEESLQDLTPLAVAAERGHMEIVKDLVKSGAKIDANPDYYTALMRACIGGHPKIAKVLLNAGADPNAKHDDGQTALHFAAKNGDAECIKLLLDHGADPNALAYKKDTPLTYARLYKHRAAIEVLQKASPRSPVKTKSP